MSETGAPIRRTGPPGEGTLADLSRPGRRAWSWPKRHDEPAGIPEEFRRATPPALPEVAERDLVRHYTRLAQINYGVDTGLYPLGSCSMTFGAGSVNRRPNLTPDRRPILTPLSGEVWR